MPSLAQLSSDDISRASGHSVRSVKADAIAREYLAIKNLTKEFGNFAALSDISLTINEGEFVCFLGPSGCGKTTLLRCIAGLEKQTRGTVIQNGIDVSNLPAKQRDFGIVFQSYALFPNLSAQENVAFGLRSLRLPAADRDARVKELFQLVGLKGNEQKFPSQLSGGQQQRVALARALAISPGLLLLDEPLSALDAQVRVRLRREIRALQRKLGVTTIMVTHDQEEALTLADRIVVMDQGKIEQISSGTEIYRTPATGFVAGFIGAMNFMDTEDVEQRIGDCSKIKKAICFRPEDVSLKQPSEKNFIAMHVRIEAIEFLGSHYRLIASVQKRPQKTIQIYLSKEQFRSRELNELDNIEIFIAGTQLLHFSE